MYIKKIKKEMTECRIIQVQKQIKKKKKKNISLKYFQPLNQKITLQKEVFPINLYLKISANCNFNCFFCSQNCSQNLNDKVQLSFSQVKNILDKAKNLGFINIYYTGGEPLLNKEIIDMVKYGHELGFNQCVITNGFLIQRYPQLVDYINKVGISLHGDKTIHEEIVGEKDSFAKISENIDYLIKNKINVEVNYTACDQNTNYNQMKYVAEYCKNRNLEMSVARLNLIGKASSQTQDINKICEIIDKLNSEGFEIKFSNCVANCSVDKKYSYLCHGCGAGISTISINCNGDISICATSNIVVGNVFKDNFKKVLLKIYKQEFARYKSLPQSCKNCKHLASCKGGCKIECINEFSTDFSVNENFKKFVCDITNKFIIVNVGKLIIFGNKLVLLSPLRLMDKKYFDFLSQLDGNKKVSEIMKNVKNKELYYNLLYCLYQDAYLTIKESRNEKI